jgi:hypothetical protein
VEKAPSIGAFFASARLPNAVRVTGAMMNRRAAALMVLSLLVCGCGSGDSQSAATSTPTPAGAELRRHMLGAKDLPGAPTPEARSW